MSGTILWVDDSAFIRRVGGMILEELGFTAELAAHGEEALEILDSGTPLNAIILDLNMPVMSGMEFLDALRDRTGLNVPPIVLCTTESDMPMVAAALMHGADEYIKKPVTSESIQERLEELGVIGQTVGQ